mmetsp:Transcript_100130/g.264518  ORF Transcript_100130/g.264518 Transcript_100130/m.264518 type:complete len:114 (+) Transcript_100130:3-344(+)
MTARLVAAALALAFARAAPGEKPPADGGKLGTKMPLARFVRKHGVDGKVPGAKVDALLNAIGAPASFEWRQYDLDGDGHLGKKEIAHFRTGLQDTVDGWQEKMSAYLAHLEEL